MPSSNNNEIISKVSPHTKKKFELIESYIETWAQKLMNTPVCNGLIFIDCMCNSGVYHDDGDEEVLGTPIRVSKILREVASQYPGKQVYLYFNDLSTEKIELLKTRLPEDKKNYHTVITHRDGNELLKEMGAKLNQRSKLHYFLLYDPYDASIDWEALLPFFRNWGEVMINHMVSDPVRAITQVKNQAKKEKYGNTYLTDFANLVPFGSDKAAYEARVEQIINYLKGQRRYFVAAFPFYNTQNFQMYSLIHCTSNKEGFKLYKKTAWKTFGAKPSTKNTHGNEQQMTLDFSGTGAVTVPTDESCFFVTDIAKYIQKSFSGRENVPLSELWTLLDDHPVFPSEGYRSEIRTELKNTYGATIVNVINGRTGKKETVVSFLKGNPPI